MSIELLTEYGKKLVNAGFRVWVTPFSHGYLTYEMNGFYGHLQYSEFDGWRHDMPLIPSREFGSAMFIDVEDIWSVEAALKVCRELNTNHVVGRQRNAKNKTWFSPTSYPL